MKPKTFQKIKRKAMKKYHIGEKRAEKIAGKAYWTSVKAKASKKINIKNL